MIHIRDLYKQTIIVKQIVFAFHYIQSYAWIFSVSFFRVKKHRKVIQGFLSDIVS